MKKKVSRKSATKKVSHAARRTHPTAGRKQGHDVHYVCVGNCMGLVNEHTYKKGATKCNVVVCSHYGHPLKKKRYCASCRTHYEPGKSHKC